MFLFDVFQKIALQAPDCCAGSTEYSNHNFTLLPFRKLPNKETNWIIFSCNLEKFTDEGEGYSIKKHFKSQVKLQCTISKKSEKTSKKDNWISFNELKEAKKNK